MALSVKTMDVREPDSSQHKVMFAGLVLLLVGAVLCDHHERTNMLPGRTTIVHLFEWKWNDVADECERFLAPKGYGGVQIAPPQENIIVRLSDGTRPWYERYQPVSYIIGTRSGNREEFLNMTRRCNRVGVRIYADVVVNHMSGSSQINLGTAGSTVDTANYSFPAVPYSMENFHEPHCGINNYNNATEVRDCELVGLKDLNQTEEYVRDKIVGYINDLISLGIAGLRVDAAKHMWPSDLKAIYARLNNLNTDFGFRPDTRPYIFQEVIFGGGEAIQPEEYTGLGDVTEFRVGSELQRVFRGQNAAKWLVNWGPEWALSPSETAVTFIDNHDTQRSDNVLTYKEPRAYKAATAFNLAHPYGQPKVMSSYFFTDKDAGPPSDSSENIISPVIYANETCGNGWVCEHRWRQIYQMAAFRNAAGNTNVTNWWDNGNYQIAFSRGNRAFVAFNLESTDLNQTLQTGLPAGRYCDVISGTRQGNSCTGIEITVGSDGRANITISANAEDAVLAIHVGPESFLERAPVVPDIPRPPRPDFEYFPGGWTGIVFIPGSGHAYGQFGPGHGGPGHGGPGHFGPVHGGPGHSGPISHGPGAHNGPGNSNSGFHGRPNGPAGFRAPNGPGEPHGVRAPGHNGQGRPHRGERQGLVDHDDIEDRERRAVSEETQSSVPNDQTVEKENEEKKVNVHLFTFGRKRRSDNLEQVKQSDESARQETSQLKDGEPEDKKVHIHLFTVGKKRRAAPKNSQQIEQTNEAPSAQNNEDKKDHKEKAHIHLFTFGKKRRALPESSAQSEKSSQPNQQEPKEGATEEKKVNFHVFTFGRKRRSENPQLSEQFDESLPQETSHVGKEEPHEDKKVHIHLFTVGKKRRDVSENSQHVEQTNEALSSQKDEKEAVNEEKAHIHLFTFGKKRRDLTDKPVQSDQQELKQEAAEDKKVDFHVFTFGRKRRAEAENSQPNEQMGENLSPQKERNGENKEDNNEKVHIHLFNFGRKRRAENSKPTEQFDQSADRESNHEAKDEKKINWQITFGRKRRDVPEQSSQSETSDVSSAAQNEHKEETYEDKKVQFHLFTFGRKRRSENSELVKQSDPKTSEVSKEGEPDDKKVHIHLFTVGRKRRAQPEKSQKVEEANVNQSQQKEQKDDSKENYQEKVHIHLFNFGRKRRAAAAEHEQSAIQESSQTPKEGELDDKKVHIHLFTVGRKRRAESESSSQIESPLKEQKEENNTEKVHIHLFNFGRKRRADTTQLSENTELSELNNVVKVPKDQNNQEKKVHIHLFTVGKKRRSASDNFEHANQFAPKVQDELTNEKNKGQKARHVFY